jgi:hypothetical protein
VGFLVDKAVLGQVFSEYFGFTCQLSLHQFLHHHNHPIGGSSAEWTQLDSAPPTIPIKKITKGNAVPEHHAIKVYGEVQVWLHAF